MFYITYWFFFNHQAQVTVTATSAKPIQGGPNQKEFAVCNRGITE